MPMPTSMHKKKISENLKIDILYKVLVKYKHSIKLGKLKLYIKLVLHFFKL